MVEGIIKKFLKKFKRIRVIDEEKIERDLIPLNPEEHLKPRLIRKKRSFKE